MFGFIERVRLLFERPKVTKISLSKEAMRLYSEPWQQEVIMRAFMEGRPVMGEINEQGEVKITEGESIPPIKIIEAKPSQPGIK